MPTTIVTTEDLIELKKELLEEIGKMLNQQTVTPIKKWLKSNEVMNLLKISPGTLQNFRVNGTIPFTKIGGILYYDSNEINKLLVKNKVQNNF